MPRMTATVGSHVLGSWNICSPRQVPPFVKILRLTKSPKGTIVHEHNSPLLFRTREANIPYRWVIAKEDPRRFTPSEVSCRWRWYVSRYRLLRTLVAPNQRLQNASRFLGYDPGSAHATTRRGTQYQCGRQASFTQILEF